MQTFLAAFYGALFSLLSLIVGAALWGGVMGAVGPCKAAPNFMLGAFCAVLAFVYLHGMPISICGAITGMFLHFLRKIRNQDQIKSNQMSVHGQRKKTRIRDDKQSLFALAKSNN